MVRSRVALGIVAAVSAAGLLAGCSGGPGGGGGGGQVDDDVLVLYTSEVGSSEIIAKKYEETSGVKVEVITGSSGELLGRVQSEAGNAQGDVWFSGGQQAVDNPDLFELPEVEGLADVDPQWFSEISESPAAAWTNTIMYNTDLVSEEEVPSGYADLADPKWKGKIQMADPSSSWSAYAQMVGIYNAGGWDLVEQVAQNLVISDNYAGPRAVSDGEASLGLFNEPSASAYMENPQVEMVYPEEGIIGMTVDLWVIKGTQRESQAEAFLDWFYSEEGQTMVAEELPGLRSTLVDAPDPEGMVSFSEITMIQWPDDSVGNRGEWVGQWEDIITNV